MDDRKSLALAAMMMAPGSGLPFALVTDALCFNGEMIYQCDLLNCWCFSVRVEVIRKCESLLGVPRFVASRTVGILAFDTRTTPPTVFFFTARNFGKCCSRLCQCFECRWLLEATDLEASRLLPGDDDGTSNPHVGNAGQKFPCAKRWMIPT